MAEEEQPSSRSGAPSSSAAPSGLEWKEVVQGTKPGDRSIRIARHRSFTTAGSGTIRPRPGVGEGHGLVSRASRVLFGNPLPSAAEQSERVGIFHGLAIFASDNISSSAYATEEIMRVLVLAGVGALSISMPITLVIIGLIAVVVLSYRQVIAAFPQGGGSYIVTRENLGEWPGLVTASSLLTDYILTVAVSVSAGVAALTSAFPELFDERVIVALILVAAMTIINLRGTREAGKIFTAPTYLYLFGILCLIGIGLSRIFMNDVPAYHAPESWLAPEGAELLTVMLVMRAFASGSVALTGTEAIADGIPAFKPPEVRNAQITLVIMGSLFATIFLGLSFLANQLGIVPDPHETQTVVSQIARTFIGDGPFFYYLQFTTALILALAANTAFNGFPRLASILARDHYLPRQFSFRGDRLAFNGGIVVLAVAASALIWTYKGSVTNLIPLYTVGVFLAFTLSQGSLVLRWWKLRNQRGWQARLVTNGVGAAVTGGVALVVGISKFALGAWMIFLALPILAGMMWSVNRHYGRMEQASQPETPLDADVVHVRAIVPVQGINLPARQAIAYAEAISEHGEAVAVHVTDDEGGAEAFRKQWNEAGIQVPVVIIESPYRSLIGPLLAYIDAVRETHPHDTVTVILPEYVPRYWWENLIHNQTGLRIKTALLYRPGIVVASVPYHMQG